MGYQQMAFQLRQFFCHGFVSEKAAKPWWGLDGLQKINADASADPARYCSGGLPTELGLTERVKVMIFHS